MREHLLPARALLQHLAGGVLAFDEGVDVGQHLGAQLRVLALRIVDAEQFEPRVFGRLGLQPGAHLGHQVLVARLLAFARARRAERFVFALAERLRQRGGVDPRLRGDAAQRMAGAARTERLVVRTVRLGRGVAGHLVDLVAALAQAGDGLDLRLEVLLRVGCVAVEVVEQLDALLVVRLRLDRLGVLLDDAAAAVVGLRRRAAAFVAVNGRRLVGLADRAARPTGEGAGLAAAALRGGAAERERGAGNVGLDALAQRALRGGRPAGRGA